METRSAIDRYNSKLEEARDLARGAAKDLRGRAKDLVKELNDIAAAYAQLMGEQLPELTGLVRATSGSRAKSAGRYGASGKRETGLKQGRRATLKGSYAQMTLPEAVAAAIGRSKSGLGPKEIAETIGGNRNSIAVVINSMVKAGQIKRASRGKYLPG